MSLRICVVTPAPPRSRRGNRVTALRWAGMLRTLGHTVSVDQAFRRQRCDFLVALHARQSHASITRYTHDRPGAPLIVALTGTDLYGDLANDPESLESIELADRLIVLQQAGGESLPIHARDKVRVILQSVERPSRIPSPRRDVFEVCVLGHLREVKDPFRTAMAARLLPGTSRIRVVHVGAALTPAMKRNAIEETMRNPRYEWLGELPRHKALRVLSRCRLLSLTSVMEGGANAISEAIVASVPVVSSKIAGSIGLLGSDYSGYFPPGDTHALIHLLTLVESDITFYGDLRARCVRLAPMFEPARELQAWKALVAELRT